MSSAILFWGMILVVALGAAWLGWKLWSDRQANRRYSNDRDSAHAVVRDALQGRSFVVGEPVDFSDGELRGHFRWLQAEGTWGLRLEHPTASLRHLNGKSFPLWIRRRDGESWVLHTAGRSRLTAYHAQLSLLLPKDLEEGDGIRLGDDANDRVAA